MAEIKIDEYKLENLSDGVLDLFRAEVEALIASGGGWLFVPKERGGSGHAVVRVNPSSSVLLTYDNEPTDWLPRVW